MYALLFIVWGLGSLHLARVGPLIIVIVIVIVIVTVIVIVIVTVIVIITVVVIMIITLHIILILMIHIIVIKQQHINNIIMIAPSARSSSSASDSCFGTSWGPGGLGIHYRGVQWEGGAVNWSSIIL